MKIYRCDKCGYVKQAKQIVGNEFEYYGFKTLEKLYQFNGVIDVCESCFQSVLAAKQAADKATKTLERVGEWCLAIGLRRDLFLSCERLGMRLLDLGDEEETAVRKACELASDLHKHREIAP